MRPLWLRRYPSACETRIRDAITALVPICTLWPLQPATFQSIVYAKQTMRKRSSIPRLLFFARPDASASVSTRVSFVSVDLDASYESRRPQEASQDVLVTCTFAVPTRFRLGVVWMDAGELLRSLHFVVSIFMFVKRMKREATKCRLRNSSFAVANVNHCKTNMPVGSLLAV